jgi:adenylate cyclase
MKPEADTPAPDVRLQTLARTDPFESRLRALADWLTIMVPAVAGIAVVVLLSGVPGVERLRNLAFDQYQRWEPRWWNYGTPVRVVEIDDESLARLGPWPWPRRQMAELVESLKGNGAGVIAFDMLFSEPDRYSHAALLSELPELPEREILAAALSARRDLSADPLQKAFEGASIVAGFATTTTPTDSTPLKLRVTVHGADPTPALPRFSGLILPEQSLRTTAKGLGAINFAPDADLITRSAPLLTAIGPAGGALVLAPSLATEALRLAFGVDSSIATAIAPTQESWSRRTRVASVKIGYAEIPTEADGSVRLHFAGQQAQRRIPAWKIINGDVHRDDIVGRIILIGISAREQADMRATPLSAATPAVEIHAELLEQALTRSWLTRPHWGTMAEAALILLGAAIIGLSVRRLRPLAAGLAALLVIATQAEASWLLYLRAQMLIDPVLPGLSLTATWLCAALVVARRSEKDKRFVRSAFQRHLAPSAVERLAGDPSQLRLGGEMRETSVLACGLSDFTERAQRLDPRGMVALLNWLHTSLTGAALSNGGTLDRYQGAGLTAFWNAPVESPRHPDQACAAALAMVEAMTRLNGAMAEAAARKGRTHAPLRLGVGISVGQSLVGDMGSMQRFDYSIMGESVVEAEKLLALTHACGLPILACAETASRAQDHLFAPLGDVFDESGQAQVKIFALHARTSRQSNDFIQFLDLHQRALAAIERREPEIDEAIGAALAHPAGARYASFYAWKMQIAAGKPDWRKS